MINSRVRTPIQKEPIRVSDLQSTGERGGLAAVVMACCAVGAVTVAATLILGGTRTESAAPNVPHVATEEYGRRLVTQTAAWLGPDHADPEMRYSGSRMSCSSCHLDAGTEPGTLSLLQAAERYPRFSGRDGGMSDLQDRINGCMQRSMNGRALPRDGPEMLAMTTYIRSLGDRYAAMGASQLEVTEQAAFAAPARAADVEAGGRVYEERCAICHGGDGSGLMATTDPSQGYLFPPLWGPDSFNNGAGMHRVLTAARFIKARMPLGEADLTDDQAFDVAAFISAQPRPAMANLERDYPDLTNKPIDGTYGPFADDFPLEQHRLGPFGPIEEHYRTLNAGR